MPASPGEGDRLPWLRDCRSGSSIRSATALLQGTPPESFTLGDLSPYPLDTHQEDSQPFFRVTLPGPEAITAGDHSLSPLDILQGDSLPNSWVTLPGDLRPSPLNAFQGDSHQVAWGLYPR